MNINVDKYLVNGCMRCKYGGTPKCKVLNWVEELVALRAVVMETGLKEEIKWGVPVYTHHGKNIITINALKESANIGFFKGALLTDKHKILQQQGNIQSARIIKFSNVNDIIKIKETLKLYVLEAIAIEESGKKVLLKKNPEPIPEELLDAFEQEPSFKKAFYKLTPGRQRAYIIYFSQAKQIQTRIKRIENYKTQIFEGKGMNDHYTSKR
jgi:uncharacterized protein YdeI (YjbR/CyaY-like superfamily)